MADTVVNDAVEVEDTKAVKHAKTSTPGAAIKLTDESLDKLHIDILSDNSNLDKTTGDTGSVECVDDVPNDFFDDFNNTEFLDGLNIVNTWEAQCGKENPPYLTNRSSNKSDAIIADTLLKSNKDPRIKKADSYKNPTKKCRSRSRERRSTRVQCERDVSKDRKRWRRHYSDGKRHSPKKDQREQPKSRKESVTKKSPATKIDAPKVTASSSATRRSHKSKRRYSRSPSPFSRKAHRNSRSHSAMQAPNNLHPRRYSPPAHRRREPSSSTLSPARYEERFKRMRLCSRSISPVRRYPVTSSRLGSSTRSSDVSPEGTTRSPLKELDCNVMQCLKNINDVKPSSSTPQNSMNTLASQVVHHRMMVFNPPKAGETEYDQKPTSRDREIVNACRAHGRLQNQLRQTLDEIEPQIPRVDNWRAAQNLREHVERADDKLRMSRDKFARLQLTMEDYTVYRQTDRELGARALRIYSALEQQERLCRDWERNSVQGVQPMMTSFQSDPVKHAPLISLENVYIRRFDGDWRRWLKFRDLFETLVHSQPHPEVLKYAKLMKCLDVEKVGLGSDIEDGAYQELWAQLCRQYDNPAKLVETYVHSLLKLQAPARDTSDALLHVVDVVRESLCALRVLHQPVDSWDGVLVPVVLYGLAADTLAAWRESRRSSTVPRLAELLEFLEVRAENLPSEERREATSTAATAPTDQAYWAKLDQQPGAGAQPACSFCPSTMR